MNSISIHAKIMPDAIIGDNVIIEDDVFVDSHCIIRDNVTIKRGTRIGAGCILGEYLADFYDELKNNMHPLVIGENSLIRSYSIIYGDTIIGNNFQTGHHVTIREHAVIGHHVRIGTLSDIQGYCEIGNYVNMHSNVHIGHKSIVHDFVWIFPYCVLTNDPTPPSEHLIGCEIDEFAVIATGSILLPGVKVGKDALVAAGANVVKDVSEETIVAGNPAKPLGSVRKIKNHITGEQVYPWRYSFDRGMPWRNIGYEEYIVAQRRQIENVQKEKRYEDT